VRGLGKIDRSLVTFQGTARGNCSRSYSTKTTSAESLPASNLAAIQQKSHQFLCHQQAPRRLICFQGTARGNCSRSYSTTTTSAESLPASNLAAIQQKSHQFLCHQQAPRRLICSTSTRCSYPLTRLASKSRFITLPLHSVSALPFMVSPLSLPSYVVVESGPFP